MKQTDMIKKLLAAIAVAVPMLCAGVSSPALASPGPSLCGPGATCTGGAATFNNASGTTAQTLYVEPGQNGAVVNLVVCTDTGVTSTPVVVVNIVWPNGTIQPITAAFIHNPNASNANPINNLLVSSLFGTTPPTVGYPLDPNGNAYIPIPKGATLTINMASAIPSPDVLICSADVTQY